MATIRDKMGHGLHGSSTPYRPEYVRSIGTAVRQPAHTVGTPDPRPAPSRREARGGIPIPPPRTALTRIAPLRTARRISTWTSGSSAQASARARQTGSSQDVIRNPFAIPTESRVFNGTIAAVGWGWRRGG